MYSVELIKVKKIADEYESKLKATDPRFNRSVIVICLDEATVIHYDNAFAVKYKDWFLIFAEHQDTQIHHELDAYVIQRGERIAIEEI